MTIFVEMHEGVATISGNEQMCIAFVEQVSQYAYKLDVPISAKTILVKKALFSSTRRTCEVTFRGTDEDCKLLGDFCKHVAEQLNR